MHKDIKSRFLIKSYLLGPGLTGSWSYGLRLYQLGGIILSSVQTGTVWRGTLLVWQHYLIDASNFYILNPLK